MTIFPAQAVKLGLWSGQAVYVASHLFTYHAVVSYSRASSHVLLKASILIDFIGGAELSFLKSVSISQN